MNLSTALADAHGRPWLAAADPRLKLAWLGWVSSLSVLLDSTAALGVLFACAALAATGLSMRPLAWLAIGGLLVLLAWSTVLSQALFYDRLPRTHWLTLLEPADLGGWQFPGLRLYREGAWYGLAQSLRMLSVMLAGLCVCLSTSPERLLAALVRLHVPVAVAFMAVTALRFLPLVISELTTVRQARRLRGYGPWRALKQRRSPVEVLRIESALFLPVLAAALRRATALATSVTTRGFDPTARRTFYPPLHMSGTERVLLLVLGISLASAAGAKLLYWLYLNELYYRPALRPLYDLVRLWL